MTSHTEALARGLLYWYLPRVHQQHNIRPDWLKNPETGHNLELDILLEDLGLAIEVDGVQHGRPIKGLQRDFAAFERQQRHDMHKVDTCRARGITLYKLTIFDLTQPRFEPFIKRVMREHGLYEQFRRTSPPVALFREAEKLSRARVVKRSYRKPGLLNLLRRVFS